MNQYKLLCAFYLLYYLYCILSSFVLTQEGESVGEYTQKIFDQNTIKSKYLICIWTNWSDARTMI